MDDEYFQYLLQSMGAQSAESSPTGYYPSTIENVLGLTQQSTNTTGIPAPDWTTQEIWDRATQEAQAAIQRGQLGPGYNQGAHRTLAMAINSGDITSLINAIAAQYTPGGQFGNPELAQVLGPAAVGLGGLVASLGGAGAAGVATAGTQDLGALISEGMGPQGTLAGTGEALTGITLPSSVASTGAVASGLGPSIPAGAVAPGTAAASGIAMGPGTAGVVGGAAGAAANTIPDVTTSTTTPTTNPTSSTPTGGTPDLSGIENAISGGFQNWLPLITDLITGAIGTNAANDAADAQERSNQAVLDFARESRDKALELNQPFYDASRTALDRMLGMTGLGGTPVNQQELLNNDPSYQFRRDESMRALENSAAARGGLISGGFGRSALQLAGNFASQEYSNIYNRIAQVAGYGQGATANSQNAMINYATMAGDAAQSQGLANASAYTAKGNVLMDLAQRLGNFDWSSVGGGRRG
jgi:hypothetical protein